MIFMVWPERREPSDPQNFDDRPAGLRQLRQILHSVAVERGGRARKDPADGWLD